MSIFYTSLFAPKERQRKDKKSPRNLYRAYSAAISLAALLLLIFLVSVFLRLRSVSTPPPEGAGASTPVPQVLNLVGRISEIEGSYLVIKNSQPPGDAPKKVLVTAGTSITKLAFVPTISGGQKRFSPQETQIGFRELRAGWVVEALASSNIAGIDEFTAVQIRVLP